jgi:[NiFe] hydrogenase diaphorase moiety large subunit
MLNKIMDGNGTKSDLAELENLGNTIKIMSRCGLGQTAANPILTTLKNFQNLYQAKIKPEEYVPRFNFDKALADGIEIAGRQPVWEEEEV